jgi:hypothetical protein
MRITDKQRLDWLSTQACETQVDYRDQVERRFYVVTRSFPVSSYRGIRCAIDDAICKEKLNRGVEEGTPAYTDGKDLFVMENDKFVKVSGGKRKNKKRNSNGK